MNKIKPLLGLILGFSLPISGMAQKLATVEIALPAVSDYAYPVSLHLNTVTHLPDSVLTLVEVSGSERIEIPFQMDPMKDRTLHWLVSPEATKGINRRYELHRKTATNHSGSLGLMETEKALIIRKKDKDLWQYNFGMAFSSGRSGFSVCQKWFCAPHVVSGRKSADTNPTAGSLPSLWFVESLDKGSIQR